MLAHARSGSRMDSAASSVVLCQASNQNSPERVRQRPVSAGISRSTRLDGGPKERRGRPASATVRGVAESGKEDANRRGLQRPASARPSSALSRGDSKQKPRPASALGIGANARAASVAYDPFQTDDFAQEMVDDYVHLDDEDGKLTKRSQREIHMPEVSEVLKMLRSSRRNPFAVNGRSQMSGSSTRGQGLGTDRPASTKSGSKVRGRIDLDEEHCQIDAGFFAFQGPGEIAYKFEGGRSQEYIKKTKVLPEGIHAALDAIFTRNNRKAETGNYRSSRTGESAHDPWRNLHASAPVKKLDVLKEQLLEEAHHEGTRIRGSSFRRQGETNRRRKLCL
jgi:hypothetical protein